MVSRWLMNPKNKGGQRLAECWEAEGAMLSPPGGSGQPRRRYLVWFNQRLQGGGWVLRGEFSCSREWLHLW